MKIEFNNNIIPVLGWSDVTECKCYEQLAKDMDNGDCIIYNTITEFEDEELCAYIFFEDYEKGTLSKVFSGRVELLGRHPNHYAPLVYVYYPMTKIKIKGVGYGKDSDEPEAVMLKSKKL